MAGRKRMLLNRPGRLFRVKPGSWFAPREEGDNRKASMVARRVDENGNIQFRWLQMASTIKALKEHSLGNLVDVTDDPTAPVFEDETTAPAEEEIEAKDPETTETNPTNAESETETFVEDDSEAVEMPPVETEVNPRRKNAKKKPGGNKR